MTDAAAPDHSSVAARRAQVATQLRTLSSRLSALKITEELSDAELDRARDEVSGAVRQLLDLFAAHDEEDESGVKSDVLAPGFFELSFIGRMSLKQHQGDLKAGEALARWDQLVLIARVLEELREMVAALRGNVLGKNNPSGSFQVAELQRSLRLRRSIGDLYIATFKGGEPAPAFVFVRIRRVGNALTRLLNNPAKDLLRLEDVRMLRDLQMRVSQLLRDTAHASESELKGFVGEALQLWSDSQAMVSLLVAMSRRTELLAVDLGALQKAKQELRGHEDDPAVRSVVLQGLVVLCGRHAALDAAIMGEPTEQPLMAIFDEVETLLRAALEPEANTGVHRDTSDQSWGGSATSAGPLSARDLSEAI